MNTKIGVDLLWYKPQKVAGIGAYIKNLLIGFQETTTHTEFKFILYCTKFNSTEIRELLSANIFEVIECSLASENPMIRQLWKNFNLFLLAKKEKIDVMFFPTYEMPLVWNSSVIRTCVVIHDLQALHYPNYHNVLKRFWLRVSWVNSVHRSSKVITISQFVKDDIIARYNVTDDKIDTVLNPISTSINIDIESERNILAKYNLKSQKFLYSLSTLHPHKNFKTLSEALEMINYNKFGVPDDFVLTGIMHESNNAIIDDLKNSKKFNTHFTGYLSEFERDVLLKNAAVLLFPSIFEGFGMPVIEAMMLKTKVIASDIPVLREIAGNSVSYVDQPKNPKSWKNKIEKFFVNQIKYSDSNPVESHSFELDRFKPTLVARNYLEIFKEVIDRDKF